MTLVVGATGLLGTEIARRIAARGRRVRGLVRRATDPARVSILRDLRVELVEGDLRDKASLERACRGASAVVSTASITRTRREGDSLDAVDRQGQLDLVDAARAAGVGRFVYVSVTIAAGEEDPLNAAKRAVERRLRESGMTCTILRPAAFMEIWFSPALGFDHANARATVYGSGDQKISWISLRDVAEFASRAVIDRAYDNMVLELGGPAAVSPHEVVRAFEEATGRPFDVQHVPEEALRARAAAATDPLEKSFGAIMLLTARGYEIPMDDVLARFPVPLRSVADYAREVAARKEA